MGSNVHHCDREALLTDTRGRRFVILDRDGTVIVERNYISRPDDVELIGGAAEGLRRFEELGWGRIVVTNQSGIKRGYFTPAAVDGVHKRMNELLADQGASVEAIYVCPHRPDEGCDCRKPQTALVARAAAEWNFDPARCIYVGDKASDVALGRALGGITMLVLTGYGETERRNATSSPDYVVRDLREAAGLAAQLTSSG